MFLARVLSAANNETFAVQRQLQSKNPALAGLVRRLLQLGTQCPIGKKPVEVAALVVACTMLAWCWHGALKGLARCFTVACGGLPWACTCTCTSASCASHHQLRADWIVWMRPSLSLMRSM